MYNITMVVAMDKELAIGKNSDIPWRGRLQRDMNHFRDTTVGKTVVMGRKTYESIPERFRPLARRENVVLTRDLNYFALGCNILHNPEGVVRLAAEQEVFVIGGGEVYSILLPYTRKILVTHVGAIINGDTFFPALNGNWKPRQLFTQEANEKNMHSFSVVEYTRA